MSGRYNRGPDERSFSFNKDTTHDQELTRKNTVKPEEAHPKDEIRANFDDEDESEADEEDDEDDW